jgi:hypothetical protein
MKTLGFPGKGTSIHTNGRNKAFQMKIVLAPGYMLPCIVQGKEKGFL